MTLSKEQEQEQQKQVNEIDAKAEEILSQIKACVQGDTAEARTVAGLKILAMIMAKAALNATEGEGKEKATKVLRALHNWAYEMLDYFEYVRYQ